MSKDIISKKLNLEFKSFKMGKNGGIDLRNKENGIICQCKHIKKFSDLKSILKKELELSCPLKRAKALIFVCIKGVLDLLSNFRYTFRYTNLEITIIILTNLMKFFVFSLVLLELYLFLMCIILTKRNFYVIILLVEVLKCLKKNWIQV